MTGKADGNYSGMPSLNNAKVTIYLLQRWCNKDVYAVDFSMSKIALKCVSQEFKLQGIWVKYES